MVGLPRSSQAPSGPFSGGQLPWRFAAPVVLCLLALVLFALRIAGPGNLTDNDQERPASYILDVLVNGHWLVQHDWMGDPASKPPLYTWLAAILSLPSGRLTLLTLYLPCALAMLGSALLIHHATRITLGSRTALLAGFFLLANPLTAKLVALARTDAVFTGAVTLTAVLAASAHRPGRGWTAAWLAGALATLTKGPLGVLLGFGGLLGPWLERRRERDASTPATRWSRHLPGAIAFLVVCGGWLFLAIREGGDPVVERLVRSELVKHAVNQGGNLPGSGLLIAPAYFLARFAPWSLLAAWGLWEAVRRPVEHAEGRRWQRFTAAWLVVGLTTFGLASHQRGDLVAPLMPAGAVLAAIPVTRWLAAWSDRRLLATTMVLGLILAVAFQVQHATRKLPAFATSAGMNELAREYQAVGMPGELVHVDAPFALQFHLQTMQQALSAEAAARALMEGRARYVAVADRAPLAAALGTSAARLEPVLAWPGTGTPEVEILTLRRSAGILDPDAPGQQPHP